jgi:unsaturated chondroitin disaccharide hydrolase
MIPVSEAPRHDSATWVESAWERARARIERSSRRIGATFPHAARNGRYDQAEPHWWTAGFWPGVLWLVYRDTKDERLRAIAEDCERQLDRVFLEYDNLWHDVGFMWSLSSVARYRLLGQDDSRRRGLLAASVLASRFNLNGRFIRAWNGSRTGWAIVDCLMNLPLLHWASEMTEDPRFACIARAHADTSLRHFVRSDGSCRHIVVFDPVTGAFGESLAGQGAGAESAWSRGAAWALYGFTLSYAATGEPAYLEAARHIGGFFITHLPADGVPYWDFRAPITPQTPKDTSAAVCAASGLLELARYVDPAESVRLRAAAVDLLWRLEERYVRRDEDSDGLLLGGAGNVPQGENINVSLIYGDYFYLEALAKLRGQTDLFW